MKRFAVSLLSLGTVFALAACEPTSRVEAEIRSSVRPDALVTSLWVTVTRVDMHLVTRPEAAPAEAEEAGGDAQSWLTLFEGSERLDLMDAAAAPRFLGGLDVPPGTITQIRMVLAGDAEMVAGSLVTPVACPSCDESGLKIVVPGGIDVGPGERLTLVMDFLEGLDSAQARLDPVVRVDVRRE